MASTWAASGARRGAVPQRGCAESVPPRAVKAIAGLPPLAGPPGRIALRLQVTAGYDLESLTTVSPVERI